MIYRSCIKGQDTNNRLFPYWKRGCGGLCSEGRTHCPVIRVLAVLSLSTDPHACTLRQVTELHVISGNVRVAPEKVAYATMWQIWSRFSCFIERSSYLLPNTYPNLNSYINISIFFFIWCLNPRKLYLNSQLESRTHRQCVNATHSFSFFLFFLHHVVPDCFCWTRRPAVPACVYTLTCLHHE